jgi:hypothetical protein
VKYLLVNRKRAAKKSGVRLRDASNVDALLREYLADPPPTVRRLELTTAMAERMNEYPEKESA